MESPQRRPICYNPSGTRTMLPETRLVQAAIVSYVRQGMSYQVIADHLGYSKIYVRKLFLRAMSEVVVEEVGTIRKVENERLDELWKVTCESLRAFHPYVSNGAIVHVAVLDENNKPQLDENGEIITMRLEDHGPKMQAVQVLIKLMERRAKLNGLDAPTKTALTDPTGENEISSGSVQFYLPSNGRDDGVVSEQ